MRRPLSVGGALILLLACVPGQPTAMAASLAPSWPVLDELAKQLEDQSRPPRERLEIIQTFSEWASPQIRAPLVAALKDPNGAIRAGAAQALGWPDNDEAVPALRERIEAPGELPVVRAAAVHSLGRIGDRSVRALVVAATGDPEASVREAALWGVALGALVDPADQPSYLMQLAQDRAAEAQMRAQAIRTLGTVKRQDVVDVLVRILETEPRLKIALPSRAPTDREIMTLRYAQARDVAGWAAGALGNLDARGALPLLLKTAQDPSDFFLREMSIRSLIAWNLPDAFPVLVKALEDPLPDNQVLALMGLVRLGDAKAVDPVLARLSDANPAVRAPAVEALVLLGGPKIRPQLEAMQQKELDPHVRGVLEAALTQLSR
jgi:HEAT repeat protein